MFCPKCGDEFQDGFTVCPDCKLDLVNAPPGPAPDREEEEDFVTIATFEDSLEASMARGALEAEGIPAIAPNEVVGTFSRLSPRGFAELKVHADDQERAVRLLEKMGHS